MKILRKIKRLPLDAEDWGIGIIFVVTIGYFYLNPEELNFQFKLVLIGCAIYFCLSAIYKVLCRKLLFVDGYVHKLSYPHDEWPKLPKEGFIVGKAALESDIHAGDAVFRRENSEPLNMAIPQYGMLVDHESGSKTPLLIIQGERVKGKEIIGFVNLHSGALEHEIAGNLKLLGTGKPYYWPSLTEKGTSYYDPRGSIQMIAYLVLLLTLFIVPIAIFVKINGTIESKTTAIFIVFGLFGFSWYLTNKLWPSIKKYFFLKKCRQ